MSFNDDEPPTPDVHSVNDGEVETKIHQKWTAPLKATNFNVLVELKASKPSSDRLPLDLVMVLDVSGSMAKEHKLQKLITAVEFVIMKLDKHDRISIVTFNHIAHRLWPLHLIQNSRWKVIRKVKDIHAQGNTNITAGLRMGLRVLGDRVYHRERAKAIMLMSDGEQNKGADAADVEIPIHLPVHTFGYGTDQDPKVLYAIAHNSHGGIFSDVQHVPNLSVAFAQSLAGLLIEAVENLKLDLVPKGNSTIKEVLAGTYPQHRHGHTVTVSSFNLYHLEVRKVIVILDLPAVTSDKHGVEVLTVTATHGHGQGGTGQPIHVKIDRTHTSKEPENAEVEVQMGHLRFVILVKKAIVSANGNKMEHAQHFMVEARKVLDESSHPHHHVIQQLKHEHEHLSHLMTSSHVYKKHGHSYALSFESSHERQRYATRGDVEKHRMFATPRMHTLMKQDKAFDKDPTKPLPTDKDDWMKEHGHAHHRHP